MFQYETVQLLHEYRFFFYQNEKYEFFNSFAILLKYCSYCLTLYDWIIISYY